MEAPTWSSVLSPSPCFICFSLFFFLVVLFPSLKTGLNNAWSCSHLTSLYTDGEGSKWRSWWLTICFYVMNRHHMGTLLSHGQLRLALQMYLSRHPLKKGLCKSFSHHSLGSIHTSWPQDRSTAAWTMQNIFIQGCIFIYLGCQYPVTFQQPKNYLFLGTIFWTGNLSSTFAWFNFSDSVCLFKLWSPLGFEKSFFPLYLVKADFFHPSKNPDEA